MDFIFGHKSMDKMQDTFKNVYYEFYPALCFFANKLIKDQTAAEDLVEDVFIKLWLKEPDFSQYPNIKALLYIAVKNVCFTHLKTGKRRQERQHGLTYLMQQETKVFALFEIVRSEVLRDLHKAIQQMPIERRNVMELVFIEGWDYKKVAEHLNVSIHTVKKHRQNGIRDLRNAGIAFWIIAVMLN